MGSVNVEGGLCEDLWRPFSDSYSSLLQYRPI